MLQREKVLDEIGRYVALIVLSPSSFIPFFIFLSFFLSFFWLFFRVMFQTFNIVCVKRFIMREMTPFTLVQVYQNTGRHIPEVGDTRRF